MKHFQGGTSYASKILVNLMTSWFLGGVGYAFHVMFLSNFHLLQEYGCAWFICCVHVFDMQLA